MAYKYNCLNPIANIGLDNFSSDYVKTDDVKLLIDFGMSTRYIKTKLEEIGESLEKIDYILITHSHKDHTGGLKTLIKKYNIEICLSESMLEEIDFLKDYDNLDLSNKPFTINKTKIDFFKTSHDTNDSRGYIIEDLSSSMVYLTDTGYVNQKHFDKIKNKSLYVFEANHDIEMLMTGPYPTYLKERILSDIGHLSNNACAFYLSKLIGNNTKRIILAHLSEKNNEEAVALETIYHTFKENEITFDCITVAKQNYQTESFII